MSVEWLVISRHLPVFKAIFKPHGLIWFFQSDDDWFLLLFLLLLQDKMTQMHELCLMNYDLAILDTAFLIHKPGIKEPPKPGQKNSELWRKPYMNKNYEVYDQIMLEMKSAHGVNEKCKERN